MAKVLLQKLIRRAAVVINIGCFVHCLSDYVAEFTLCIGPSMLPTLNNASNGDVVVTEHITTRRRKLKRGDIIIAKSPSDPRTMVCKRIAALEGDRVTRPPGMQSPDDFIKIPKGHMWLLGDNADNSFDSRQYGAIPYGLVRGRVCFKIWPPSEFGPVT